MRLLLAVTTIFIAAASFYLFSLNADMPSLAAARAANAAFNPSYNPVAIFVGGTSGIGQGLTEAFADHVKGKAHIVVIGRNKEAADTLFASLPKPKDGEHTHEFVQCDVSRMKNIQAVTQDLNKRLPKINFLFMTQGIMTMKGRDETEEGLDKKMALHYYSRWKFTNDLLPLLKKAKDAGEDAKVLSVFSAGKGGEININDLGLKKTFSTTAAGLQKFAALNPGITFAHAYPGGVNTNLLSSSDSTLLKATSFILQGVAPLITTTPRDSGDYLLHGLLSTQENFARIGSRGEDLGMKRWFGSEEAQEKLWEHTVESTKVSS